MNLSIKNKYITLICSITIIVIVIIIAIIQSKEPKDLRIARSNFKLNTIVEITVYSDKDAELIDECFALCDKYEAIFSRTQNTSELYQLNASSNQLNGSSSIPVSEDLAELITIGLHYGEISNGLMDISIAPVSSLWNFTSEQKSIPKQGDIQAALPKVGYQNISIANNEITRKNAGIELDLGAIAKGYIADQIKEFLLEEGVTSAIINLGGNLLCIGEKPDGSAFQIGIKKPFEEQNTIAAVVELRDWSAVSSGIYERYFKLDNKLYHHILNPKTGYPFETDLLAVTILSKNSVDGDCLSTTCMGLGLEKGMELIDSIPDIYAAFITNDGKLHYSKGFLDTFSIEETNLP